MRHLLRCAVLLSAGSGGLFGQFHLPGTGSKPDAPPVVPTLQKASKPAAPVAEPVTAPGHFDYYALSLAAQPGRVLVSGFAPRLNEGTNPESCGTVKAALKRATSLVAPLMQNEAAVQREWARHGSCTGLNALEYFNTLRFARSLVQIPVQVTSPDEDALPETPRLIEAQFVSANPGFPAGAFRAAGLEIEVCFDRQLKPQACPTGSK
jgi:ribonuclease T2